MGKYEYKMVKPEETAVYFLQEVLKYYYNGNILSYLIALNLAGVSEEVIGKLLKSRGAETALETEKKGFAMVSSILKLKKSDKQIHNFLNSAKNSTKHESGDHYLDPKVDAQNMLKRAIENYERYYGNTTSEMNDFLSDRQKDLRKLVKRVSSFNPEK